MTEVIKICPSAEQLNNNCYIYHKHSIKKAECIKNVCVTYEYHCPEDNCKYSVNKCFSSLKLLKQHYRKIHMIKKFSCLKCNKSFATESFLRSHNKICGIIFSCSCGASYTSFEALLVHCKKKNHHNGLKMSHIKRGISICSQLAKFYNKVGENNLQISVEPSVISNEERAASPEVPVTSEAAAASSQTVLYRFPDASETVCKETQTSQLSTAVTDSVASVSSSMFKINTQTQTIFDVNCKRSVSMQTLLPSSDNNNYYLPGTSLYRNEADDQIMKSFGKLDSIGEVISSGTQTSPIKPSKSDNPDSPEQLFKDGSSATDDDPYTDAEPSKMCNELYFDMDGSDNSNSSSDFISKKFLSCVDAPLVSLEDLTSIDDGKLCTSETQTEKVNLDGLLDYLLDNETQTAFTDFFEHSCQDTFTQTCNNSLLADLDFVNIETQTPWSL